MLDLETMTEAEVVDLLFLRLARRNLMLLIFSEGVSQISLFPSGHRPKEWIAKELVQMATYQNLSVESLLRRAGCEAAFFSEAYLAQAGTFISEKCNLLSKEIRSKAADMSEMELREQIGLFLELALHSQEDVATLLEATKILASHLNLNWKEIVGIHQETKSEYEHEMARLIREKNGKVAFEDFFNLAMYNPSHGVYSGPKAREMIGPQATSFFTTSSENKAFPLFLARGVRLFWEKLGKPARFDVVEMGAGNGTLAEGILTELERLSKEPNEVWNKLYRALIYHIVEISPSLAENQRQRLQRFGEKFHQHVKSASLDPLPEVKEGLFFANELLGQLAPAKLIHQDGETQEVYISSQGGLLQECVGPLRPEVDAFLRRHDIHLDPDEIFYVQREIDSWLNNIHKHLERGFVLSFDYGNRREKLRDLRNDYWTRPFFCFGGHHRIHSMHWFFEIIEKLNFPFNLDLYTYLDSSTGIRLPKDMTLFTDFSTVEEGAGQTSGLIPIKLEFQREFLGRIQERLKAEGESFDPAEGYQKDFEELFSRYGSFRTMLMGKGVPMEHPF